MGVTKVAKRGKDIVDNETNTSHIHDPICTKSLSLQPFNASCTAGHRLHLWLSLVAYWPQFFSLLPRFPCMFMCYHFLIGYRIHCDLKVI